MPNVHVNPVPIPEGGGQENFPEFLKRHPQVKMPPNPTLAQLFKKPETTHPFPKTISKVETDPFIKDTCYIGVEVEVEGITNRPFLESLWESKEDGSLRNDGIEYITYPTPADKIPMLFTLLQTALREDNTPSYTSRTSIHIHMNVLDMNVEQVKSFVLLYLCFEKLLYTFAGNNREKSIFCVPLSHAGYVPYIKRILSAPHGDRSSLKEACQDWHKYTGLNLHPVFSLGTIEFRHLFGTDNTEILRQWLALILKMRKVAMITSKEKLYTTIIDLNTNSEYEQFASFVFEEAREFLHHSLQEYMEEDVTHIKECFSLDVQENIIKKDFLLSSFFSVHKLKKHTLSTEEKELSLMSKNELQNLLEKLVIDYSNGGTQDIKDAIADQYKIVQNYLLKFDQISF